MPIAALLGGLAVMAGAFGTHSLRGVLSERSLEIFATATRYQLTHAVVLLIVGLLLRFVVSDTSSGGATALLIAAIALLAGMVIFCGSLYALSLGAAVWLGAIAPIGGLLLIFGWFSLAIGSWQLSRR